MPYAPRGLPKYEAIKRFWHASMRGSPRLGASVPRAMTIDECMGLFERLSLQRGAMIFLDTWVHEGVRHPQRTRGFMMMTFGEPCYGKIPLRMGEYPLGL